MAHPKSALLHYVWVCVLITVVFVSIQNQYMSVYVRRSGNLSQYSNNRNETSANRGTPYQYCSDGDRMSVLSLIQTKALHIMPKWYNFLSSKNDIYYGDMILLFYVDPSQDERHTLHNKSIHFIIKKHTSWGVGRNRLWEYALMYEQNISKCNYKYWMFLDQDVVIREPLNYDLQYELFQSYMVFLNEWEPAISFTVYFDCCNKTSKSYNDELNICAVDFGDPIQYLMHREVMNNSLVWPLRTKLDDISWWHSGYYFHTIAPALFKNYIIQFLNFSIRNGGHHHYPGGEPNRAEIRKEMKMEMGADWDACWDENNPIEVSHHGPCNFGVPTKKGDARYDQFNWNSFADPHKQCTEW
eukprot:110563_1